MASIEEFETRLKEVVNAKRLSGSKLEKLTELSMKLMRNDTQLVSILYRTHKSLPASAKISSLYVFDALCRAARSQVVKRNLTGTVDSEKGNCATFLLKIDSVLDGLFQDLLSSGIPEAKEKTKKILDIWTKANTFPAEVITRLEGLGQTTAESSKSGLKERKDEEPAAAPKPVADPRKHPTPPAATPTPPVGTRATPPTAEAAQAALLALLTSTSGTNNPSNLRNQSIANVVMKQAAPLPPPQPTPPQAQLEQLQLALLQQLSKKNNNIGASSFAGHPPQNQAQPAPAYPVANTSQYQPRPRVSTESTSLAGTHSPSPVERGPYPYSGQASRDPRSSRFGDAQYGYDHSEQYQSDWRRGGNTRGSRGGFRGRGRGEFGGHYGRDPSCDSSWDRGSAGHYGRGPPPIQRRFDNRSQSPPPRRRDNQTYHDAPASHSSADQSGAIARGAPETGKDEFGRDIRSGSVESNGDPERARSPVTNGLQGDSDLNVSGKNPLNNSPPPQHSATPSTDTGTSRTNTVGLDNFDISTFDTTSAESWQALGNAFQVTNGYVPTQEELIYIVMSSMGAMVGTTMEGMHGSGMDVVGIENSSERPGTANGVRNLADASQWSVGEYTKSMNEHRSDAVVLGPTENDRLGGETTTSSRDVTSQSFFNEGAGDGTSASSGSMQKVGDRWVFVRNEAQSGEN